MAFEELVPIIKPTLPKLEDIEGEVRDVLSTGMITNYKYVRRFEERVAEYLGVKYAVAVSSCTSGLMLVLKSLLPSYSRVVVPSFTFVATVHSLVWNNLQPTFVDIDDTLNVNPELVENKIEPRTSAILAVHLFGNPCNVDALQEIAERNGLKLVFDSAHAFGARYKDEMVGGFGDAEVFSLAPTKVLTANEGGVVATNDEKLAEDVRIGRDYGNTGNYDCRLVGLSARMSEFNAIIATKSLEMLEENIAKRQKLADIYHRELGKIQGISFPKHLPHTRSTWYAFPILLRSKKDRNLLGEELLKRNIHVKATYFNPPCHLQKAYRKYSRQRLPVTEDVSKRVLSLPLYSHLATWKVEKICDKIKELV